MEYNGSRITSGGNTNVTAGERDLTVTGSAITGTDVSLGAKGNVRLEAGENTNVTTTENKFSSASIGASFTPQGLSNISVNANKGNGNSKESLTAYSPTLVVAENTLSLTSGKDMDIIGSKAQGEKITAKVGGNLKIETLQEKENFTEENKSAGFEVSWNVNQTKKETTDANGNTKIETLRSFFKPTFSASWNKGNIDSHYRSAREQTGFFAGSKGFDIYVEKNTDLKGGIITSKASPDKNKLSTGTLSFSDLKNEADYSAKSIGATYHKYGNFENMSEDEQNKVYNTKGLAPNLSMPVKGDASSTTKAAVAAGTIDIRENPTQDISALSRDTANSLNELGKIFDKAKIEERQELAAVFGEEAFRLLHNMKDDGSGRKIAAHAIIGGLMSQITGAGFASGAIGAGLNEALIKALDGKDPGTAQLISAIIGAAAAKAIGGNAQAGASAAASGTKWNKYEKLPKIREQLDKLPESEVYQDLKEGQYILLYTRYNNQTIHLVVDNQGNAWDLPGGYDEDKNGDYFKSMPPTIIDTNLKEFKTGILEPEGQYLGKILPSAKEISTSKNNVQNNNMRFKQFASVAHEGLDWAGYIPGPIGSAAGAAETALYLAEGDYSAAILSATTIIPGGRYIKVVKKLDAIPGVSRLNKSNSPTPSQLPTGTVPTATTLENLGKIAPGSKDIYKPDGKSLRPNIQYQAGEFDYLYKTDQMGRLSQFKTDNLQLTQREGRLRHNPNTPGKEQGNQAAHLAADRFGGSPKLANLVSQSANVNQSSYRKLENKWAKAIKEGKTVKVEVNILYEDNGIRPSKFVITHTIDGKPTTTTISNTKKK